MHRGARWAGGVQRFTSVLTEAARPLPGKPSEKAMCAAFFADPPVALCAHRQIPPHALTQMTDAYVPEVSRVPDRCARGLDAEAGAPSAWKQRHLARIFHASVEGNWGLRS